MLARPSLAGPLATERVSINSVGQEGDRASRTPSVTGDGRMVLFASEATNLAPGDANGAQDIFLHDWSTGLTQRVSLAPQGGDPNGASAWPKISADGSTIAFASEASNLVAGDGNGQEDVFVLDLVSGEIELISVSNAGAQGDAPSSQPVISGDGRFVAFVSSATNLFSGATSGYKEVFLLDRSTGMLQWVSRPLSGTDNDNDSGELAISQDGNWVAFSSVSTNLVSNDTNASRDVFLWSRPGGSLVRISVTTAGLQANGPSYTPSLSAEGRFVGFRSHANNLVPDDTNYMGDIFRLDRQTGQILRASVTSSGQQSLKGPSDEPVISSDGRFIAFKSYASDLVPDDDNSRADIFLRDMQGATTLVSVNSAGVQSTGNNYSPAMSSDGAAIAFYSEADNLDLLLVDNNGAGDVFAHGDPPQPEPTATPTETATLEPTATTEPTLTPTVEPSPTFTLIPTNTATPVPTSVPPTYTATPVPTTLPPTYTATPIPTTLPPTYTATPVPTDPPTPIPTYTATSIPTSTPATPPTSGMAPVIELKSEASLNEGGELSLSGNFADPDSTRWEASVDYGDGEGFVSLALNDKRGFKLSRRYGDDGEYRVTVRVKDESGAYGEALLLVKVKNKNPLLENDPINALEECDKEVRESGRSRGRSACRVNDWYVATAGQPTVFTFDMEDPGSDDLLVHWSFGDDAAYFNAGDKPDPDHSPNGTYPFRVTHSASYVFDKPGVKYVTVEVKDDDGGVVSQKIKVLVRGTESCSTSLGYWIQRFKKDGFSIYSGELRAHLSILSAFVTSSFGEFSPEMIDRLEQFVLTEAGDSAQARAQLITAWLNFTNGSVDWDEVIDDADGHRDLPYGDVLREILAILLESNPSRDDYKRAIELAQSINLHRRGSSCPAYDD